MYISFILDLRNHTENQKLYLVLPNEKPSVERLSYLVIWWSPAAVEPHNNVVRGPALGVESSIVIIGKAGLRASFPCGTFTEVSSQSIR